MDSRLRGNDDLLNPNLSVILSGPIQRIDEERKHAILDELIRTTQEITEKMVKL